MSALGERPISGHVFRVEGGRRAVWRAKYRLPDGRQVQKTIGPAWTERGRPAGGYFTKRTAEAWLRALLDQARDGTLPGMVRTGVTFADACEEYLRWLKVDRERKPSTVRDYASTIRAHLIPAFGPRPVEDITADDIERWKAQLGAATGMRNSTKLKILTILSGVFERARKLHKLPRNPMVDVEKPLQHLNSDIDVFTLEEVMALVRAARSEQDAAIYLTAALTGLRRGELVALRWRDIDFTGHLIRVRASYTEGGLTTPKSGKVRAVPMAPQVATDWRSSPLGRPTSPIPTSSFPARRAPTSTPQPCTAATSARWTMPACARCDSTICATRSALGRSARRRSCRSKHGWATRTSRRR